MSAQSIQETFSKLFQFLRRVLIALLNLYLVGTVLYLLLHWLTGEAIGAIAIAAYALHLLLLPAVIILPVMLLNRHKLGIILSVIPVLVLVGHYAVFYLPQPETACAQTADSCRSVRVMTYNAFNRGTSPADLVAMIREADADIIGLQEVSMEQAEALETQLQAEYPYRVIDGGNSVEGIALLSRYPILEHEIMYTAFLSNLRATVEIGGQPVTVVSAHPPPPQAAGATGIVNDFYLFADYLQSDQPVILLGDFNTTDTRANYRLLRAAGYQDAYREAGYGFGATWPSNTTLPRMFRIDYVFVSGHFRVREAWVGDNLGSDHSPVLAELVW